MRYVCCLCGKDMNGRPNIKIVKGAVVVICESCEDN